MATSPASSPGASSLDSLAARGAPPAPAAAVRNTTWGSSLRNALALRGLSRQQKCFDQLTRAVDGHTRETLVPLALGHIGLRVQPGGEQRELRRRDLPTLD